MLRVGEVLQGLVTGSHLGRRLAESRALEAWRDVVGGPLAERTRPLRIAGGRLFVMAPGSALRQELVFHKATILRRFNEVAGGSVVREIVFFEGPEPVPPGESLRRNAGEETS